MAASLTEFDAILKEVWRRGFIENLDYQKYIEEMKIHTTIVKLIELKLLEVKLLQRELNG